MLQYYKYIYIYITQWGKINKDIKKIQFLCNKNSLTHKNTQKIEENQKKFVVEIMKYSQN